MSMKNEVSANAETVAASGSLSRENIVARLKEMLVAENVDRAAVDALKSAFYKLQNAEKESSEDENSANEPDAVEAELKELLAQIKEKRQQLAMAQQKEEADNLAQKQRIIDQLTEFVQQEDSSENVSSMITEVRALQEKWKSVGNVNAAKKTELNRNYQKLLDQFYDFIKINNELRDYDFKHNLETKTKLCEEAESLAQSADVVAASKKLQLLHKEWSETGPVSREKREELWNRFKAASTQINKQHQQHFENLKNEEQNNLDAKIQLCEQVEQIDFDALKNYKDWEEKSAVVKELQEKWKTIGFAPKKSKVLERFHAACNEFFRRKNEFFKQIRTEQSDNLTKKIALCEKVEAMMESSEWKATSDRIIKLQKEWRTIGHVGGKQSEAIWKRFTTACDSFFERKKKAAEDEHSEQQQNLDKKQDIISRLKALEVGDSKQLLAELKKLMDEWKATGHVPFGKKDGMYEQYHTALREKFAALKTDASQQLQAFRVYVEGLSSENELSRLYSRLQKEIDKMKSEIASYENNMSFFSFDSKNAGSIKKNMEKTIEKMKREKENLEQKIKILKEKLK